MSRPARGMDTFALVNARVLTMEPSCPNASSVTVHAGRIVALDAPVPDGVSRLDCAGGVLLPGFIDPHVHLLAAAAALESVDCSPQRVRSIAEVQAVLAHAQPAENGWIRAVGYDEFALAERRHPTRWELDQAVPNTPVRLIHCSGHASVLNGAALVLLGITIESEEPAGGVIDRRLSDGEPTGLLLDMDALLRRVVPPLHQDTLRRGIAKLDATLLAHGVTAVQDLTPRAGTHDDAGSGLPFADAAALVALSPAILAGAGTPRGPVKIMLAEAAGVTGRQSEQVVRRVLDAHTRGQQVAVHATTEDGVRLALRALRAAQDAVPRDDPRHRIEHASLCPPELAAEAASLGVVIVSNPAFLRAFGDRYRATIPAARLPNLYAVESLRRAGVTVAAASDTPVVPPSPLASVRAAMLRATASGAQIPGARMNVQNALALVTRAAAYVARAEHAHGVIAPGRAADLVLLSDRPDAAREPTVCRTWIGGGERWTAPGCAPMWPHPHTRRG